MASQVKAVFFGVKVMANKRNETCNEPSKKLYKENAKAKNSVSQVGRSIL